MFDFIVIGAGIAGASVSAHLAEDRKVLLLEMEEQPGYHTTGRSGAAYEPNYGPAPIRALTRAARQEFDAGGYLTPRETIFFMPPEQQEAFDRLMREQQGMREISLREAKAKLPPLREAYAARALLDPATADIDVDRLLQDYLRLFKARGGVLICGAPATAIRNGWQVTTPKGEYSAKTLINAAGAWGDHVAKLAGAHTIGLQPKRRSIAVVPGPAGCMDWPLVGDVAETWYCKPQSGKLLVSSADATLVEPHDAYADDMAIAEGIDRFQRAADLEVTRVEHNWGGLRSFAPDGHPVVGLMQNARASSGSSARAATASRHRPHFRGWRRRWRSARRCRPTSRQRACCFKMSCPVDFDHLDKTCLDGSTPDRAENEHQGVQS